MPTLSPLLEEVLGSITDANPVGEDISYDDDFLALKDEVDQLSSVSPEGVDFNRIVETCRIILSRKAKDLRVATYMAMALSRVDGYSGVLEGLLVQKLLVERYWEPMYPPVRRMRARQNALQFAAERLSDLMPSLTPRADDGESIERSLEAVKELQAFTTEKMEDQAPILSGLKRALEDAQRKLPRKSAEKVPEPQDGQDGAPDRTAPPVSESAGSPHGPSAAPATAAAVQTESEALEQVLGLAGFLREQSPFDPVCYRLARIVRWDPVGTEPTNQSGKTLFHDPPPHRLTYLNTLLDDQDWKTLLEVAESAFREAPYHFWLDLQRFVVSALEGLGDEYEQAKESVLLETALLIRRVGSLPRLTFTGGTPFADSKTKFWLDDVVAPILISGHDSSRSAVDDKELEEQFEAASRLAAGGKLGEAMGVLQNGMQQDGARRGRFLRRFNMAQICMQADKPSIACPILENLETEIESFNLDEWEPELALEVWSRLHQCYDLLRSDESVAQDRLQKSAERVFARICQVDPARALET